MLDGHEPDPYEKRADWRPVGVDILSLSGPASGEVRQRRMSVLGREGLISCRLRQRPGL